MATVIPKINIPNIPKASPLRPVNPVPLFVGGGGGAPGGEGGPVLDIIPPALGFPLAPIDAGSLPGYVNLLNLVQLQALQNIPTVFPNLPFQPGTPPPFAPAPKLPGPQPTPTPAPGPVPTPQPIAPPPFVPAPQPSTPGPRIIPFSNPQPRDFTQPTMQPQSSTRPLPSTQQQPANQPLQLQPRQPNVPVLDQTKPCPQCDRVRKQRDDLTQHIETERMQQLQQQIDQQQQLLDQYTQQEQQQPSQRNIPQELQQKMQLLNKLNQEISQLTQQSLPAGGTPPVSSPGGVPILAPQSGEQLPVHGGTPMTRPVSAQPAPQGVTFCVGCESEEDAILFLNGEPAKCSVIPGSTQPLNVSPQQQQITPVGNDARVASLGDSIRNAISRIASTASKELCAHPIVLRAAYEAPVAALVAGLVAECPECAVAAAALGQRFVDSGIDDFNSRYCHA